jgi:hypothetical protein
MMKRSGPQSALTICILLVLCPVSAADELDIPRKLHAYFQADDLDQREQLATDIAAHPDFDPAQLTRWLHAARLFKPLKAGRREVSVPLSPDLKQPLTLRIPEGYDPKRAWPLLYALHGMGGNGNHIITYFEHALGPRIDEFVVVAPTDYRVTSMRTNQPPQPDHRIILREIRRRIHVDANRQYATGYSMGGHASWTIAGTMPDEFAAIMPIAGSFTNVHESYDREIMPDMANTFVASAWGRKDVMNNRGEVSQSGGIAGSNQEVAVLAAELKLPFLFHEFYDQGHGGVIPPASMIEAVLSKTRMAYPATVRKTFRSTLMARAYWLEGRDWIGPMLDGSDPISIRPRAGENPNDPKDREAMRSRAYRAFLGRIEGEIAGQQIQLNRRKVRSLIVWFGPETIDWNQPITIRLGGRRIYDGTLEPDVFLCLQQVERTWDLDRLRLAGLHIESQKGVDPITGRTELPYQWGSDRADSAE